MCHPSALSNFWSAIKLQLDRCNFPRRAAIYNNLDVTREATSGNTKIVSNSLGAAVGRIL